MSLHLGIVAFYCGVALASWLVCRKRPCRHAWTRTRCSAEKDLDGLSRDFDALMRWVDADYDYYAVCSKCGAERGLGERYE